MTLNIKAAVHFHVNENNTVTASCCIVNKETSEVFGFCKTETIPNDKAYVKPGQEYLVFPDDEHRILYPVYVAESAPKEAYAFYYRDPGEKG